MEEYHAVQTPYSTDGNPERISLETVKNYTLDDFGLTIQDVKDQMFGIKLVDEATGKTLPDRYITTMIKSAVAMVEKRFDIKILPQVKTEEKDQYLSGGTPVSLKLRARPVLQVEEFSMRVNGRSVMRIPDRWWKLSSLSGQIQVAPMLGSAQGTQISDDFDLQGLYTFGRSPLYNTSGMGYTGFQNNQQSVPQLYHVNYVAGMLPPARDGVEEDWEMPTDLRVLILKQATKDVLMQWGRLIIGAGIASKSFSMDEISEAITTTQSAMYGGAGADIKQLDEDIANLSKGLDAKYGIRLGII